MMLFSRFFSIVVLWLFVSLLVNSQNYFSANDTKKLPPGKLPQGIVKEKPKSGRFVKCDQGYMVAYKTKIPGTEVIYEMVPIPGGTFLLGSPKNEKGREKCEGPQVKVNVKPFWMGKYEITWGEYHEFMKLHDAFKDFERYLGNLKGDLPPDAESKTKVKAKKLTKLLETQPDFKKYIFRKKIVADAITAPSNLYTPSHHYTNGEEPYLPAVTMSNFAAKQYTKWLTKISGTFHRLPCEAEWEYACRAGSKTTYHFGNDPKLLGKYAWYEDNSDDESHAVGKKAPNSWGLHDMYGNVSEWVLDAFDKKGYEKNKGSIFWPSEKTNRCFSVRGGSYQVKGVLCRSASRLKSDDFAWKDEYDPNDPKSPWWYADDTTLGVGFRIIRPLAAPVKQIEQENFWKAHDKKILEDVAARMSEGKGAIGSANPALPKIMNIRNKIRAKEATIK